MLQSLGTCACGADASDVPMVLALGCAWPTRCVRCMLLLPRVVPADVQLHLQHRLCGPAAESGHQLQVPQRHLVQPDRLLQARWVGAGWGKGHQAQLGANGSSLGRHGKLEQERVQALLRCHHVRCALRLSWLLALSCPPCAWHSVRPPLLPACPHSLQCGPPNATIPGGSWAGSCAGSVPSGGVCAGSCT